LTEVNVGRDDLQMGETLSVILVTHNRLTLLEKCLTSLKRAGERTPSLHLEILAAVNGKDLDSEQKILEFKAVFTKIVLMPLEQRLRPAEARNLLLSKAQGNWVYFLDDDAEVPNDIFLKFMNLRKNSPEASVIGGPNLTPGGSSSFQVVSGKVLASPLATFFTSARYSPRGKIRSCGEESLILCNLFVKAEAISKNPFPSGFVCAEENWVLLRLRKMGCQLLYDPSLFVWHHRRGNLKSFVGQIFKYGFGRGQVFKRSPVKAHWAYLLPSICILYSLTVLVLRPSGLWPIFPYGLYFILCGAEGLREFLIPKASLRTSLVKAGLFPVTHVTYGLGLLMGFVRG
jgi:succinoglycan biosynthesis protein ExoA